MQPPLHDVPNLFCQFSVVAQPVDQPMPVWPRIGRKPKACSLRGRCVGHTGSERETPFGSESAPRRRQKVCAIGKNPGWF